MNIALTLGCNNHCPYCFQQDVREDTEMPLSLVKQVLEWANFNIDEEIRFLGGEPTMYTYFPEVLDLVRNIYPDNNLNIISNIIGNENSIEALIRTCYFYKERLSVLINSTYDDNFEKKFYKNLSNLIDAGLVNESFSITLMPNFKINKKYMDRILKLFKDFPNITNLRIGLMSPIRTKQITEIYNYDNEIKYLLDNLPWKISMHFDCPINFCQISKDLFDELCRYGKGFQETTGLSCNNAVLDVLPDASARYCFSSSDFYTVKSIFDFTNKERLYRYLGGLEQSYIIKNKKCINCELYKCGCCTPCHSFDEVLLKGEEEDCLIM